jgi:ATP-dependent DNA helicase RecG
MENEELILLVNELRALPKENEWVEFKSNNATTNEKFGQYISAISNAACINNQSFGYLVFGINDTSHQIEGTTFKFKNRKEGNQELELWVRHLLHPSVKFQFFECQHGKHYLEIFKIPAAVGEPTHFKKIPYIRFDSSVTDLRNFPHHIKAIYNSSEDWSANIKEKATLANLDENAIAEARIKFKEKKTGTPIWNEIDSWDNKTFLDKAKITFDGKITNTAILLLGKPEAAHFLLPAVAQITWKLDTEQKAYEHFGSPLFMTINEVLKKIRIVRHKFFPNNQLIATEVLNYDTEVILEALNNCIAHQDYSAHSRIIITEKSNKLIFQNAGSFFEGKVDDYLSGDKTPKKYRNRFLVEAMFNLNMIDSLGYGIYKMTKSQYQRYFPLPDYSKSVREEVVLEIYGNSIDENFAKVLIEQSDRINLTEGILLDKVQKSQPITKEASILLKKKGWVEGRYPNLHISASIASITGEKADYMKQKGIDDAYCQKIILDYLQQFGKAKRTELEAILLDKLPDVLDIQQKRDKVKNNLQTLKKQGLIQPEGKIWKMSKPTKEKTD